jgi:ribosomal protein S18 acetylase RimI-like enzyme
VRPAAAEDAAAVAEIQVGGWRAGYGSILPAGFLASLSVERRRTWWGERIGESLMTVLVVDDGGEVVGFVSLGDDPHPGACELYALYVHPERWRRGYGSSLLRAAESAMRDRGFAEAVLWVFAANDRARRFYEHHGWAPDGVRKLEEIGGVQPEQVRYRRRFQAETGPPEGELTPGPA